MSGFTINRVDPLDYDGYVWENEKHPVLPVLPGAGDFDGDGVRDLAVVESQDSGKSTFIVYANRGIPREELPPAGPVPVLARMELPQNSRICGIGDYNGDGRIDIMIQSVLLWKKGSYPRPAKNIQRATQTFYLFNQLPRGKPEELE